MTKEERYNEEYGYDRMATLELGMQEGRKYNAALQSSDGIHPCVKYKTWMFSLLIGVSFNIGLYVLAIMCCLFFTWFIMCFSLNCH